MNFVNLPRTDLRVSQLCFGTAELGASVSPDESLALLDQFWEAGGNFLDTAAVYADWTPAGKGSSEKLLAQWLPAHSGAVVATKGGHPELAAMGVSRLSKREVERDLDASLKNLGVEAVDLYYLHRDDPALPAAEIVAYLEEFVAAGKIRYYGFSNWKLSRAEEAFEAAQTMGARGFVANQPLWNLAQPDLTGGDQTLVPLGAEARKWHAQHDFPVIPYSSQAGGYFDKIAAGRALSPALSATYDSELVRPINRVRLMRLEAVASESGLSLTQLVLGYLTGQPFPTVPIIGCRNAAQLRDSLSAADVQLSAAQIEELEGS